MPRTTATRRCLHAFLVCSLTAAAMPLVAGCADPARARSERAVGSLKETRDELADGRKQIDHVQAVLAQLEAKPADLKPAFRDYQSTLKTIETEAADIRDRVQDMRLRAAQYSTAWSQDTSQNITDPTLRATAEARAQAAKDRFAAIDRDAQAVRAAYDPFITELRDLDTYLSNDLSYGAIDAAKPMFGTVRSSGETLKDKVDQLLTSLDAESQRLSPTTSPTP